jgi:hypothetical protein
VSSVAAEARVRPPSIILLASKFCNSLDMAAACSSISSRVRPPSILLSGSKLLLSLDNIAGVKGQVRDVERNLRSYFRVAIIRVVSKPRT